MLTSLTSPMALQQRIRVVLLACGSFNPITNMHLRMFELARDHLEDTGKYRVVKGIISPVGDGYRKTGLIEARHRIEMARLATQSSSWISVDDWECQQAEWVETAKVIRHHHASLLAEDNDNDLDPVEFTNRRRLEENGERSSDHNRSETPQVKLLCGADVLESFSVPNLWKEEDIAEIVGRFGLVCVTRGDCDTEKSVSESEVLHIHRRNIHLVRELATNEISATHVRQAVRSGQSVHYLLPEPVVNYVYDQHLYTAESEQINADVILAPLQRYGRISV